MVPDRIFYPVAVGASALGTVIGDLLGWTGDALFAAGMIPLFLVMLFFVLKERAAEGRGHPTVDSG